LHSNKNKFHNNQFNMAIFQVKHITQYTYQQPVTDSVNQVMLYPPVTERQQVHQHKLTISGNPLVETFTDHFGNRLGIFTLVAPHAQLSITSEVTVETKSVSLPHNTATAAEQWQALDNLKDDYLYMDYLQQEGFEAAAAVKEQVISITSREAKPLESAEALSAFVYHNFHYQKGITSVETGIDEVWQLRAGVCQDFAHILLVMLRMLGIPARYVSGYICPRNSELRGEGATHAWVEACLPGYGWLGFDPTNNCITDDRHIHLAVGRSFSDCTPVKGTYRGSAAHTLEVSVVIADGTDEKAVQHIQPVFSYQVKAEAPVTNSYRQFMEQQQQQ
jgi:transglutaminase-like putative cysteine protease